MNIVFKEIKNSELYPFILTLVSVVLSLILVSFLDSNPNFFGSTMILIFILSAQGVIHFMNKIMNVIFTPPFLANGDVKMFHKYKKASMILAIFPPLYLVFNFAIVAFVGPVILLLVLFVVNFNRTKRIKINTVRYLSENNIDHFIFTSGRAGNAYQTNQWIPVLEKSEHSFAIIVKNFSIANAIDARGIPIFVAPSMHSMEGLIQDNTRSILYTGNSINNVQLLRFTQLKHIFINHGESDKVVNQNKFMMSYDHLFLGGKLAEDRLREAGCDLRPNQPVFIGRPQAELFLEKREPGHTEIRKILYAPTWEGVVDDADYSSVRLDGLEMLEKLLEDSRYEISVKFHPLTGSRNADRAVFMKKIEELASNSNLTIYPSDKPIQDLMNWSDAMICDISSVLNEYLYTSKPMALTTFERALASDQIEKTPSSKACYSLEKGDEITEIINKMADEDQEQIDRREEVLEYSLSASKGSSLKRFDNALHAISVD